MTEINSDIGTPPQLAMVNIDTITVDNNYQRDVLPNRVRRILERFCWRDFQPVTLADQGDGTYCVIDGQHRVHAARLHPDVSAVPAAIINLDGDKRGEAASFVTINTERTAVTPVDRYWAGIEAGDEHAMQICAVLEDAGCDVVPTMGHDAPGKTNAVTALSRAVKTNGEGPTVRALKVINAAWPTDPKALKGTLIQAVARIIKYSEDMDDEALTAMLARSSNAEITANAEGLRKLVGGSGPTLIARTLAAQYNKGRRVRLAYFGAEPK